MFPAEFELPVQQIAGYYERSLDGLLQKLGCCRECLDSVGDQPADIRMTAKATTAVTIITFTMTRFFESGQWYSKKRMELFASLYSPN